MNLHIYKTISVITILFMMFLVSCEDNPFRITYSDEQFYDISGTEKVETETGLVYYIIEEGSGTLEVTSRDVVHIKYTGRTLKDGEVFDSSYRNGNTSAVSRPVSNFIDGFKEGLLGMKVGGKRVLIIPPELGYGNSETHRLRNDTLRFDVELTGIEL